MLAQLTFLLAHDDAAKHTHPILWFVTMASGLFFLLVAFFYFRLVLRSRQNVKLLNEGKAEEFLDAIDEDLAKNKAAAWQRFLKINKSAGFSFLGRFAEGVAVLDEVDINKLRGTVRSLYLNNLLYILTRSDVPGHKQRARDCYETHRQVFDNPGKNKALMTAIRGTRAAYLLLIEDDTSSEIEKEFQKLVDDETMSPFARAQNQYFLALIASRRDDLPKAKQLYDNAREMCSNCYLGPIPGVTDVNVPG